MDMDSSEIHKSFKANIKKCLKNDGTVVALVVSIGKAQEVLYELRCMQKDGELNEDILIYFDGKLAIRYTDLYINDGLERRLKKLELYVRIQKFAKV